MTPPSSQPAGHGTHAALANFLETSCFILNRHDPKKKKHAGLTRDSRRLDAVVVFLMDERAGDAASP